MSRVSKRDLQRGRISVMSLEHKTALFWEVSYARNHPNSKPVSTEDAIGLLSDLEEYTSVCKPLGAHVSDLLDDIIHGGSERKQAYEQTSVTYKRQQMKKKVFDYTEYSDEEPEPPRAA